MGPVAAAIFFIALTMAPVGTVEINLTGDSLSITATKQASGKWDVKSNSPGKIGYDMVEKGPMSTISMSRTNLIRERLIGSGPTRITDAKNIGNILNLNTVDWQTATKIALNTETFGENPGFIELEKGSDSIVIKKGTVIPEDLTITWKVKK